MQNEARSAPQQPAGAEDIRRFASGETAAPPPWLAVAKLSRARLRQLGLPRNTQTVVRLSRKTCTGKKHRRRFSAFGAADWRRAQRVLAAGAWVYRKRHGAYTIYLRDAGTTWVCGLKRMKNGALMMVTYFVASEKYIAKLLE